jgi:hypothetical protein
MPERDGIEIFVPKHFVSETTQAIAQNIVEQINGT